MWFSPGATKWKKVGPLFCLNRRIYTPTRPAPTLHLTPLRHSERLAAFFLTAAAVYGASLTTWSPRGAIQSYEANECGHSELAGLLCNLRLRSVKGSDRKEGVKCPLRRAALHLAYSLKQQIDWLPLWSRRRRLSQSPGCTSIDPTAKRVSAFSANQQTRAFRLASVVL